MPADVSAKEIMDLKAGYGLFSRLTRMPYVECEEENYNDQALLYASKKEAEAAAEEYAGRGIPLSVQEMKIQEVLAPVNPKVPSGQRKKLYLNQVRQHLSILPLIGVNAVGYKAEGKEQRCVELTELLPKGFEKKIEDGTLYQPNLQLTGLYLMQEARKKKEFLDMKHLQELDEEFSANLVKAHLFIGVLPPEGMEKEQKLDLRQCRFPYLKHQNGSNFFPLFTDMWEFQKYQQNNKKIRPIQVPFAEVTKFRVEAASGYMLNPMGFSLPLTPEMIPKILERFGVNA